MYEYEDDNQEHAPVVPQGYEGEYVSDDIQLDFKIVNPATDKVNPESDDPVKNITRDVVLSRLDEMDIDYLKDVYALIKLADLMEKKTGKSQRLIKGYFGTIIHTYVNLKRAEGGFTAQLVKTKRVETVSGTSMFAYPYYYTEGKKHPLAGIPIIGGLFK
jgi:hypothetical protein